MSDTKYNFKRIPSQCLIDIYHGINKEILSQPIGERNFKKALVSWKNRGLLTKLHKKYSQFSSGKNVEVDWGKSEHMIPYNRIQEIYNDVRKKYGPLGNPKINLWNRGDKAFKQHNKEVISAIKKGGNTHYLHYAKWIVIKKISITLDDGTKVPAKFQSPYFKGKDYTSKRKT